MNRFDLPNNFIDNPETWIKKMKAKLKRNQSTSSTYQLANPPESEDQPTQSLTPEIDVMADKSLCEFSAPTTANICTGPAVDINGSFELKPVLINIVQTSQFYGKAHEDASAHLQHFVEIALSLSRMSLEMLYYFAFSHSHSWGKRSSGSTSTRRRILRGHCWVI